MLVYQLSSARLYLLMSTLKWWNLVPNYFLLCPLLKTRSRSSVFYSDDPFYSPAYLMFFPIAGHCLLTSISHLIAVFSILAQITKKIFIFPSGHGSTYCLWTLWKVVFFSGSQGPVYSKEQFESRKASV